MPLAKKQNVVNYTRAINECGQELCKYPNSAPTARAIRFLIDNRPMLFVVKKKQNARVSVAPQNISQKEHPGAPLSYCREPVMCARVKRLVCGCVADCIFLQECPVQLRSAAWLGVRLV